jgi:HK97 family phage major capsid protein
MATVEARVRALNEKRIRAYEAGKAILDRAADAQRGLTDEERQAFDRTSDEMNALERQRDLLLASDEAKRELEVINAEFRRASTPSVANETRANEADEVRRFLRGETNGLTIDLRRASYVHDNYRAGATGPDLFERRGIYSDAGGGSLIIPSLVSSTVYAVMQSKNIMRQTRMSVLTTPTGDPTSIPVGAQGAATQIATQDTVVGGTDPTMASKVLSAYDIGQLVAVSQNIVSDSNVDVLGWVGETIAAAVATKEEQWWVAGTGTNQPLGIMNASATGSGGTVATGGSLILGPAGQELEKLIDVQYSINSSYRSNGEWLTNDLTAARLRKVRDGSGGTVGSFCWSPSPTAGMLNGQPDTFLGRPIFTSSNVASMASDARILCYGDLSYFVARQVQGLQLARSTDLYFDRAQIAVRGISRIDSDLTDSTAVVHLHQAVQ